jgi:hypothetical protein
MNEIAILAYGSLISDPGPEIEPLIVRRVQTDTPFPVEYGRLSRSRGGAPTLVPHSLGAPVKGELLILADSASLTDAKNILYRREIRKALTNRQYAVGTSPNAVLVQDLPGFCGVAHVLYTDFHAAGKIASPQPEKLAKAAVDSVSSAPPGKDGISYLIAAIDAGVKTPRTDEYREGVFSLTKTSNLVDALKSLSSDS